MKHWLGPTIFTLALGLTGCGDSTQPAPTGGTRIAFTEIPTLQYYLLSSTPMPNGHRDALVQENGRNGVQAFMRYDVDCAAQRMILLGRAGTAEAARGGEGAQPASLDASTGFNAAVRASAC